MNRLPGVSHLVFAWILSFQAIKGADFSLYSESLENGAANWSWASVNLANSQPIHSGTKSIAVTVDAWEALYLHFALPTGRSFTNLTFWIHGGTAGGQLLNVQATLNGAAQTAVALTPLAANTWQEVRLTLSALGVANRADFDGLWISDRSGGTQPIFFVDDIRLLEGASAPVEVTSLFVDAAANARTISDLIYGMNFATAAQLEELNVPLNRSGGNPESRYNWKQNAHNRGMDWYFQSLGDGSSIPGASADEFIQDTKAGGAEPMITVPMIGWVAKLGPGRQRLSSFSISKYGQQTDRDSQWFPDAGNGILLSGAFVTNNDPNDASVLVDVAFQREWIQHLTNRWGRSSNGGVRYYILDNEHGLWHSTHRDVYPQGVRMQEILDKSVAHARAIKEVDAAALVVGPEEWGWSGYLYSGYDQWYGAKFGWGNLPDRAAHGGMDYLPWYLKEMKAASLAANQRLLDIFSVHFYPQSGEFSANVSSGTQLKRNRSTRGLWDTNYVDESWIATQVKLIPRLRQWADQYYFPGTPIALTEYSWGADEHINGATAQADLLGIFGREGLDMANRWVTPPTGSPTYRAIKLYRNYDGNRSTFGNVSVKATTPDPDKVAAFAARRTADGALTIMTINKQPGIAAPFTMTITNHSAAVAEVWELSGTNAIVRKADLPLSGNILSNSLPAQSITLFVLKSATPKLELQRKTSGVQMRLMGQPGASYVLEKSSNLVNWSGMETNSMSASQWERTLDFEDVHMFYRARTL
ncbi:MAG: glycoside hydrolase family 44 protein [Verrucomicrobiota bacterium]|nr:glycoside hydrolase family 44 protein [Verrucomicrobiota bacterium]